MAKNSEHSQAFKGGRKIVFLCKVCVSENHSGWSTEHENYSNQVKTQFLWKWDGLNSWFLHYLISKSLDIIFNHIFRQMFTSSTSCNNFSALENEINAYRLKPCQKFKDRSCLYERCHVVVTARNFSLSCRSGNEICQQFMIINIRSCHYAHF